MTMPSFSQIALHDGYLCRVSQALQDALHAQGFVFGPLEQGSVVVAQTIEDELDDLDRHRLRLGAKRRWWSASPLAEHDESAGFAFLARREPQR